MYQQLLKTAVRQSKSPIHNRVWDTFFYIARPKNAKRIGACSGSYPIISPQRDSRFSSLRLYRGSHRQKGSPGVLRRDVPWGTQWNKKKKDNKRENDTESDKGEKERFSQSVPCSRIMARTHCSNYLCIRLTLLSAEPAGRGTCVTNMRARPPTLAYSRAYVRICTYVKKWMTEKNIPRQETALVGCLHERKEETTITILSHIYI